MKALAHVWAVLWRCIVITILSLIVAHGILTAGHFGTLKGSIVVNPFADHGLLVLKIFLPMAVVCSILGFLFAPYLLYAIPATFLEYAVGNANWKCYFGGAGSGLSGVVQDNFFFGSMVLPGTVYFCTLGYAVYKNRSRASTWHDGLYSRRFLMFNVAMSSILVLLFLLGYQLQVARTDVDCS